MTGPRPGRGRPGHLDDETTRDRYLTAIANGMRLGQAADHVGIHRNIPTRYRRTDPKFATALQEALALGKKIRENDQPHDESRYNHQGCRCRKCTRAAADARIGRRRTQEDEPAGQLYDLPAAPSPQSFPLARAS